MPFECTRGKYICIEFEQLIASRADENWTMKFIEASTTSLRRRIDLKSFRISVKDSSASQMDENGAVWVKKMDKYAFDELEQDDTEASLPIIGPVDSSMLLETRLPDLQSTRLMEDQSLKETYRMWLWVPMKTCVQFAEKTFRCHFYVVDALYNFVLTQCSGRVYDHSHPDGAWKACCKILMNMPSTSRIDYADAATSQAKIDAIYDIPMDHEDIALPTESNFASNIFSRMTEMLDGVFLETPEIVHKPSREYSPASDENGSGFCFFMECEYRVDELRKTKETSQMMRQIVDLTNALTTCPEDASLFLERANKLIELGLYSEAVSDAEAACKLSPCQGRPYSILGKSSYLMGDHERAFEAFEIAISIEPSSVISTWLNEARRQTKPKIHSQRVSEFIVNGDAKTLSKYLVKYKGHIQEKHDAKSSRSIYSPMVHIAVKAGQLGCLKTLLRHGFDISTRDADDRTPLMIAIDHKHSHCALFLLNVSIESNAADDALTKVENDDENESIKVVNLDDMSKCVVNNYDVQDMSRRMDRTLVHSLDEYLMASCVNGMTALHRASLNGMVACVKALLDASSDIFFRDADGCNPLHLACRAGHAAVSAILLDHASKSPSEGGSYALASQCNRGGNTPASLAAMAAVDSVTSQSHLSCVEVCLHHMGSMGRVASANTLIPLAHVGAVETIALALVAGVDVKAKDSRGRTALHIASEHAGEECVKLLLSVGMSANVADVAGITPLDLAATREDGAEIRKLLVRHAISSAVSLTM